MLYVTAQMLRDHEGPIRMYRVQGQFVNALLVSLFALSPAAPSTGQSQTPLSTAPQIVKSSSADSQQPLVYPPPSFVAHPGDSSRPTQAGPELVPRPSAEGSVSAGSPPAQPAVDGTLIYQAPPGISTSQLWWEREIVQPMPGRPKQMPVNAGSLMQLAMSSAQQVRAVEVTRWIRNEQTNIASAEFDAQLYTNGRFDDTSDPVGNSLTTGGPPRLNEHIASIGAGLRRKTLSGASVSLSQQLGHDNSNSLFFDPNDQGNTRMSLELRQPILEGRGRNYNQSFVVETVFQTEQAEAEYLQALQDRLFDVGRLYWTLYRTRATLVQQRRHVDRAAWIAEELEERQILDALKSQVLRAQAAVATRRSELAVAEAEVRNAEARIRALINAACLQCDPMPELIPVQLPPDQQVPVDTVSNVRNALCQRPEMRVLAAQMRAADVRTGQAANETLPTLDLVLESYVSGLEGNSQLGEAWVQQFSDGAPSYGVGLQFSTPLGNRAARSRFRQRKLDQTRIHHLLNDQSDRIRSEVEIAARNTSAAYQTLQARRLALQAVNAEMDYLRERWQRLRGDPNLGQLQLDDLLNAQVRLFEEEKALAAAQAAYGTALLELQRSVGGLVGHCPTNWTLN